MLAKDKSIIISKSDKGNAVVLQNVKDYKLKINKLLETDGKFVTLRRNPTRTREEELQKQLRILRSAEKIDLPTFKKIYPCGSRPGVLYGLPKIHKEGTPLRPIISAIKTYNYNLAKYLDKILKPLVDSKYTLIDTYDFVNKISHLNTVLHRYLVSFDVESLFTNVPTLETIELILDLAFPADTTRFHELTREDLKELLIICTQQSHFQFNGKYYDQIDGVAMGSPLGPLFANVFMDEFERRYMDELKAAGVSNWFRYVDDIFASLDSKRQAEDVLALINSKHPNLRFTIEHETGDRLPFLDTCVERRVNKYSTTIYRKKTFTGVYLNWTSMTARRYKISLIRCLADRAWKICSENKDRLAELDKLKVILAKNEYPPEIVERSISAYLESKAREEASIPTAKGKPVFLKLPYVNKKCDDYAHRLKKLVSENYWQTDFNVAFQAPHTIGKLFPFKDTIKDVLDRSLVVYSLKCGKCDEEYIGKTERLLGYRIKEHSSNAPSNKSACKKHERENLDHKIKYNQVEILDNADTDHKLRIKELLHILKRQPLLNKQLNSQSNYDIKTLIIQAYPQFRRADK